MKIEKLNENKIRVTFNNAYLQSKNVDVHSFMANSIESQALFLNILDEAEKEVGFITDNYKLSIEALALSDGSFILTVTRIEKEVLKSTRVQAHRKISNLKNNAFIYKFSSFDDFCNLKNFLSVSMPKSETYFSDSNLYQYNNFYFLILENLNSEWIDTLSGVMSEFAVQIEYSELVVQRIKEFGTVLDTNLQT